MGTFDRTVPNVHLHIGDERRATGGGGVHEHVYPATGEVQGPVPLAGVEDVDDAVRAASAAFETWRTWTPWQRRDVLVHSPAAGGSPFVSDVQVHVGHGAINRPHRSPLRQTKPYSFEIKLLDFATTDVVLSSPCLLQSSST